MALQTGGVPANASGSDKLGRYYTRWDIGDFLVGHIDIDAPRALLDLGAGAGSLASAAAKRWSETNIFTVDVDVSASTQLKALMRTSASRRHSHIRADALSTRLPELLRARSAEIDAAVCNPPFIKPAWRSGFGEILEDVGLSGCVPADGGVDAALLFLAQNLRMIERNARLGIILPDTMISTVRYRRFRQELVRRYAIEKIIKLPRGSFLGTDALASIVVLRKGVPVAETVPLCKLTADRRLSAVVDVTVDQAIERLDYDYHSQADEGRLRREHIVLLSDLSAEVSRGSIENAVAGAAGISVLHTSGIDSTWLGRWRDLSDYPAETTASNALIHAEPGDILVARVGRNLHNKICGVKAGSVAITDCVYRVRLPKRYRNVVLRQLASIEGQEWLSSRAYGVSARQLTKADLLTFPIAL
ncbi:N-6 DNA methylase [Ralstonia solanacearum]|uniref:N-6 DNA methylase n=1 Tax=Ralstonia solanacearum TaxID=305 RepID=UPI000E58320F|nr:N-6 DNA methylase [Ralstonia solanacearum]AXW24575.1 DNA methylase [Ralstonia solanacearum]